MQTTRQHPSGHNTDDAINSVFSCSACRSLYLSTEVEYTPLGFPVCPDCQKTREPSDVSEESN